MKTFYISFLLFTTLLCAITANYFYVSHLSRSLVDQLEQLPAQNEARELLIQSEQIRKKWETSKKIVQITVNHSEIESISNAATEMCTFAQYQNTSEFERARRILISTLKELGSSEKLSPTNIL